MFSAPKIALISGAEIRNGDGFIRFLEREKVLIICADGGANHLRGSNIAPALIVGDMDSISPDLLDLFATRGVRIERHPRRKEQTDTALALQAALSLKPESVSIYGALGGRIDHTWANIALLAKRETRWLVKIVDENCEVIVASQTTRIKGYAGQIVSLFPFDGEACGITLSGFEYELVNGTMQSADPYGISNVLLGEEGIIHVRSGKLLVVQNFEERLW